MNAGAQTERNALRRGNDAYLARDGDGAVIGLCDGMITCLTWLAWIHNIRICWTGPAVPIPPEADIRCSCYDLDRDGDVDLHDLSLMLQVTQERECGG